LQFFTITIFLFLKFTSIFKICEFYEVLKSIKFAFSIHGCRYMWLTKNKDRVVTMLTKVLAAASDGGMADLYFRVNSPINAHSIIQTPIFCHF